MNPPQPFAVWAPVPSEVTLVVGRPGTSPVDVPLCRDDTGWWSLADELPEHLAGGELDYGYRLDGADPVLPDPRSRRQPAGVHALSRTFDPAAYAWADAGWTGRQLAGGVIYELHVGTFTADGTLTAAIERLDHLAELGIDFVEVMPVNAFNGPHGWGYDGVLWYAVQEEYGGPTAYQEFVDACHARGLGVIQDVVYNHLGPSGNYLPRYGPYFKPGQSTWGDLVNLDGEESDEVRRYILDNASVWLRDYHVDGLRLDAVHALVDTRATHLLEEMAVEADVLSAQLGRPLSLIAESDLNAPRLITPREAGGFGLAGQWSDDFHHALYVSLTGDATGYYADFDSLGALAKVVERGFFHDGTYSSFRRRHHGRPIDTERMPAWRLVVCSDNHDQIGNRAAGTRLSGLVPPRQGQLAALVTVLSPFTPMIFMGEEWGAATPWQFFTSHPEPDLAEAVAKGRLAEFAGMQWDTTTVPDPQDPETFARSHLNWSEPQGGEHAELLALYRRLLELRRTLPAISDPRFPTGTAHYDDETRWWRLERGDVVLAVHFGEGACRVPVPPIGEPLLELGEVRPVEGHLELGPWSAAVVRRG